MVGRTGAGKSSLMGILLRLVEVHSGSILLYGQDIRTLPLARLRSSYGVVPQIPLILEGTLQENLDPMGRYQGEITELASALKMVSLWDFFEAEARQQLQELKLQRLKDVQVGRMRGSARQQNGYTLSRDLNEQQVKECASGSTLGGQQPPGTGVISVRCVRAMGR